MAGKVLDVEHIITPDQLACEIANHWEEWSSYRNGKVEEWKELRNYVFATDTRTTSNSVLPWSNSTTTPKLAQIRDNLHANYFAALFPSMKWMRWQADDMDSSLKVKRDAIQGYMENKVRQSDFIQTASRWLDDYILYGNVFGLVDYVSEYNEVDGEIIPAYVGPKAYRISPFDIVFNPTADDFLHTPKILRSVHNYGEIKKMDEDIFNRIMNNRSKIREGAAAGFRFDKEAGFIADGFGSLQNYYDTNYVEMLTFYGDIYDHHTGMFKENKIIKIVDRAYIVEEKDNPSWLGHAPIYHAGWRDRPDNIYSMGPLDNLVGMQYRIDHLENLKADVFDQIATPVLKIRGEVEDFVYEPGAKVYMGDDGDVNYLAPEATALNADFQISTLESKMEEMAGAPRQAMGFRTPGEKTAFEVNSLETSANRIFQHKAAHFERVFLEKILNGMLEAARRNMDISDTIRVLDDTTGAQIFSQITKEDITAKGKIIPMGARHFAERSQRVSELNSLLNLKNIPDVGVHMSGKLIAKLITQEVGEESIYTENIALIEASESEKLNRELQVEIEEEEVIAQEVGL